MKVDIAAAERDVRYAVAIARSLSGRGQSFPSGEATEISSMVTPFVLKYGKDDPAVYALELLPIMAVSHA